MHTVAITIPALTNGNQCIANVDLVFITDSSNNTSNLKLLVLSLS
jgi:hypothetical protein